MPLNVCQRHGAALPYLHRELARIGAVDRLRLAADVLAHPAKYLADPCGADHLHDIAILIEKQIAAWLMLTTPAPVSP